MISNARCLSVTVTLLFLALNGSGCVTANFKEPITAFQQSIDTANITIGTYYTELNQFERELYLEERLLADIDDDKKKEVMMYEGGKPTPILGQTFSAESIKARTDAIALLGIYSRRLAELAGSDSPTRFAKGTKVLGENLAQLENTFKSLSKSNDSTASKPNDSTALSYTEPIRTIVSVVGQMFLESRRDEALTAAIQKGAQPVREVLDLLENDLVNIIAPLQRTGTMQILADSINYYNRLIKMNEYKAMNPQQRYQARQKALDDIRRAAERYEIALTFNPSGLVHGMKEAHEALVKYAQSDRKPENLAELVSAMEVFDNRVRQIAVAVLQLRDLREGGRL